MSWPGQTSVAEQSRPTPLVAASNPQVGAPSVPEDRREKTEMTNVANIGKSLHVKGELSGDEDLTVEGAVEGKITLNGHRVTISQNGSVTGEIHAKSVLVGGQVTGNITADEKAEVAATGRVLGDVRAPRVAVADGARFKGSIDMDTDSGSGARAVTLAESKVTGSPTPYPPGAPASVTTATS